MPFVHVRSREEQVRDAASAVLGDRRRPVEPRRRRVVVAAAHGRVVVVVRHDLEVDVHPGLPAGGLDCRRVVREVELVVRRDRELRVRLPGRLEQRLRERRGSASAGGSTGRWTGSRDQNGESFPSVACAEEDPLDDVGPVERQRDRATHPRRR